MSPRLSRGRSGGQDHGHSETWSSRRYLDRMTADESVGDGGSEVAGFRVEHDSMGEVRVPASARWGAQTQRAVENFPISGQQVEKALITALALIKGAAAAVNAELGVVARDVAEALEQAADEVASGGHPDQFPIDVFQTGSGTSTNMNMNEVLAHLATERLAREIRPNDEPNASQSSNDAFPSAI